MGQRDDLSQLDIKKINMMYRCETTQGKEALSKQTRSWILGSENKLIHSHQ